MSRLSVLPTIGRFAFASLLLLTKPAATRALASATDDALARPEFDKELSLNLENVDVVAAFRLLSGATSVPFVIDFNPDPQLRLTFKAENMVGRGILASIANTYRLTFTSSAEGVVVRRAGSPPAATKLTVGSWPLDPERQQYQLDLVIRDPSGRIVATPRLLVIPGVKSAGSIGWMGLAREVMKFNHTRNLLEPEHVGGVELRFSVRRADDSGLDMIYEVVVSRPISAESYSEEHIATKRTFPPGESIIAKTSEGYELVLTGWQKFTGRDGGKP